MSNGVPVIASDLGAPKEIITDGVNGYTVDPISPHQLSDAVIRLLGNDKIRKEMGESGRQHVQRHYNDKDYAHAVENIYAQVLGEVV